MEREKIIEKYYNESVMGLTAEVLADKDLWYIYVTNLPIHLQVVYTVVVFHNQVFNGGFHQYFFNAYGQFAFLTTTNLRIIKADEAATLLEKALEELNSENLSTEDFRDRIFNRQLERISMFEDELCDFMDHLDKQYGLISENIDKLLAEYLLDFESC